MGAQAAKKAMATSARRRIVMRRAWAWAFQTDTETLAWATAAVSVTLFAAAAAFLRYLRP